MNNAHEIFSSVIESAIAEGACIPQLVKTTAPLKVHMKYVAKNFSLALLAVFSAGT